MVQRSISPSRSSPELMIRSMPLKPNGEVRGQGDQEPNRRVVTACEGGLGEEEKSAAGSVHRAGANKLRSRVKGVREGPLSELLSSARRIDTSFPTRRRADDERHWPLSGSPPWEFLFLQDISGVLERADVLVRGGMCSCRSPRGSPPPLIKQSSRETRPPCRAVP